MTTNLGPGGLETSERSRQTMAVAGSSIAEAAAAGVAAVLAIIGLAGTQTFLMMSIATITLGGAFMLREGGIIAQSLRTRTRSDVFREQVLGSGLTASTIAGITGIALGILALVDVDPSILVPAAVIVFGGALLLGNAPGSATLMASRVDTLGSVGTPGGGGEMLVGMGATALGILALVGVAPLTLSLVALLALGVATFLVGGAVGAKVVGASR